MKQFRQDLILSVRYGGSLKVEGISQTFREMYMQFTSQEQFRFSKMSTMFVNLLFSYQTSRICLESKNGQKSPVVLSS